MRERRARATGASRASGEQTLRIPTPQATLPGRPRVDALSLAQLRASADPRFNAELHWRVSWVLITVVLGLLAVPLARLRPRQGRHARVVWAVLLFAVYAGLLSAGRTLLERGETAAARWGCGGCMPQQCCWRREFCCCRAWAMRSRAGGAPERSGFGLLGRQGRRGLFFLQDAASAVWS